MHFKLIIALVDDERSDAVIEAAKEAGATGASTISNARGEGMQPKETFFGLELNTQREMILFLVEEHLSRTVLETIGEVAEMDTASGGGIAFMIDVEDAVGVAKQAEVLVDRVEDVL